MLDLDILKTAEVVIGLIGTLLMVIIWLLNRWMKRVKAIAEDTAAPLHLDNEKTQEKLVALQGRVDEMDVDLGQLGEEVGRIKSRMGGLAKKEDVSDLKTSLAARGAELKKVGQQVDTLYRAALAAGQPKERS